MLYKPRRPPASSPSPPATRYLQHLLPTGRLCTATLPTLPTSVTMQGLTTDITLTGGVYHFFWEGYSFLFSDVLYTLQEPQCVMTRTDSYHTCLLFVYTLKTDKRKTPHTCLYQPHGGYRSPCGWLSGCRKNFRDAQTCPRQLPSRSFPLYFRSGRFETVFLHKFETFGRFWLASMGMAPAPYLLAT
jgi:hypothetical protein